MRLFKLFLVVCVVFCAGAARAQDKGWLGVELTDVAKDEAEKLGWETPRGAKIVKPLAGGPAEKSGIAAGDIVLMLDGQEVESRKTLEAAIEGRTPGTQVRLRISRGGRERTITAALAQRPTSVLQERAATDIHLVLDTGGHRALVKGLAFTPDGQQLISAGDDKVIRFWDIASGRTVKTIRGEIGPGHEGKFFALALSPDGRTLAGGGYLGNFIGTKAPQDEESNKIRIHDVATGELKALLVGHGNIIGSSALAFSPDGTRLLSGSADNTAILWDFAAGKPIRTFKGHANQVYAIGFSPDGTRVATGSFDSTVRYWQVANGTQIGQPMRHNEKVRVLAVSPRDGTIAAGSDDGEIRLWDGETGRLIKILGNQGGIVGNLRFTPDGQRLLSTCGFSGCQNMQRIWDIATGQQTAAFSDHGNIVIASALSPDGRVVATGGGSNQEVRLWDIGTGKGLPGPDGRAKNFVGTGSTYWAASFSSDSRRIAWGTTWRSAPGKDSHPSESTSPLEFQLRLPIGKERLGQPERIGVKKADAPSTGAGKSATAGGKGQEPEPTFVRARRTDGAYSLVHRKGGQFGFDAFLDVSENGQVKTIIERDLTTGNRHLAYGFSTDGKMILSGGSFGVLKAYDLNGKTIADFLGHEGDIWTIAPSPDGRMLISASGDQTVRLWSLAGLGPVAGDKPKRIDPIVTLYNGSDGEWVMWTPQGYYAGSPGADRIVRWHINQGPTKAAREVGAEQLRERLNRPDIVARAIELASADAAIKEAPGTDFRIADLLDRPPPVVRILSPANGAGVTGGTASVRFSIDPGRDPVKRFTVRVNGVQVSEQSGGGIAGEIEVKVPLGKGDNRITIVAQNNIGESKADDGTITVTHQGEGALDRRGTLHILAVGIDKYANMPKICGDTGTKSCDLSYPGSDARAFEKSIRARLGAQHRNVVSKVLIDGGQTPPTAANVRDALGSLRNTAAETDTVVVFIAGHGINDGADYLFLPSDTTPEGSGWRGSSVIPWVELERIVFGTKGRRYLFVDTCHAAGAYNAKLGNSAYHADIVAFTSAGVDEEAVELSAIAQGVFTYSIVDGLAGAADRDGDKLIRVEEMGLYLRERTKALIDKHWPDFPGKRPVPEFHKGRDAGNHVLTRL